MTSGPCAGGYRVVGTDFCTHGPDARPAGRRPAAAARDLAAIIEGPLPDAVLCDGDGTSGRRVQAVYARLEGTTSNGSAVIPRIRAAAAGVQATFLASAARTDGVRRPRWVTDDDCALSVIEVTLSDAARTSFNQTIRELASLGLDRPDRKYLVWWEASVYCGIATFWGDDRPGQDNASAARTGYGRVDAPCWGWAESHELMHTLGAVQNSAPHTTYQKAPGAFAHCTDDYDVMCYRDAPGVELTVACPDRALDAQFDCGNDDYFHTDPRPGSYLASHWNAARSPWLADSVAQVQAPVPTLVEGRAVSDTRLPVQATLATRAALGGLESIEAQRRAARGRWRVVRATDGTSAATTLRVGVPTRFRARTVDAGGVETPWLTGAARTARLSDDRAAGLSWRGGWTRVTDAGALGRTLRRATADGARLRFRTRAAEVGIVAARGPLAGRLVVRVDGRVRRTVELRSADATGRTIVAAVALTPGRHTIEVRVRPPLEETPGWLVDLDAVAILAR